MSMDAGRQAGTLRWLLTPVAEVSRASASSTIPTWVAAAAAGMSTWRANGREHGRSISHGCLGHSSLDLSAETRLFEEALL